MQLEWEALRTIEAVVRLRSVDAAAKELSMQHSSVTRRILSLEKRIGSPLFTRGARLQPTELALELSSRVTSMRRSALDAEELINSAQRRRENRLIITTSDVLAPLVFVALNRAALTAQTEVIITDEELTLTPGEIDVAIRPSQDPTGSLKGRRLGPLTIGVFKTSGAPKRWILPSAELRSKTSMRWWKHIPTDAQTAVVCNSLLSIRDACRAGLGSALFPTFLAWGDDSLRLEREVDGGTPLWLLTPAQTRAPASVTQLFNAFKGLDRVS